MRLADLCPAVLILGLACPAYTLAESDTVATLEQRVAELEAELTEARQELARARAGSQAARPSGIRLGPLRIGGAMRVNYVYGSYEGTDGGPSRGGDGGNVELDTFRLEAALDAGPWIGRLQYRWYPADAGKSYSFLHTAWLGYRWDENAQVEVGMTRVPFGPGPFGLSHSWFFDQHYYVGLADDSDLGVKYSHRGDDWDWDLAYFWRSEPNFSGRSEDSTRYGNDPVRWRETISEEGDVSFDVRRSGYREANQANLRAIRKLRSDSWESDIGVSLQWGQLDGSRVDDGEHWAASLHAINRRGPWALALQLTRYGFDIDADNPWNSDELIPLGAYDFAWPVATEAWLPALSLSYLIETGDIPWLDSVRPYAEYSTILKEARGQFDSDLAVLGAAWTAGAWYVYTDMAWARGNFFVGNEGDDYSRVDGVGDFGVAGNRDRHYRLNLNFGYYF
ncbi:MAG: carbohydrate porin [Pseudomonadota bacterium]